MTPLSRPTLDPFQPVLRQFADAVPTSWSVSRFGGEFTESRELNGSRPIGPMLSVSGYRGVELQPENAPQLPSGDVAHYRVLRPGQLAVNTMWLNYGGLGVSALAGYISPAYRAYSLSKRLDERFTHYLLRSDPYIQSFQSLGVGVRPNAQMVDRALLRRLPILLPPLDRQRSIADFLDRETAQIDAMIEAQAHLVALLRERRAAELLTSITRGLNPSATLGPSSVNWIGDSPLHWQFAQIKRLSPVLRGASPRPIENPEYFNEEGDHGWVRISDVTASRDGVLLETTQTLSELGNR